MKGLIEKILERFDAKKQYFQKFYEADGKTEEDECINKATQLAFDDAKNIVQEVAEEYNNGWIACSERLPEDGVFVLVQDFDEYYEIGKCEKRNGVIGITSGDWWTSANNYIAWQQLPEPYQPKGE